MQLNNTPNEEKKNLASVENRFKLLLLDTLHTAYKQDLQPKHDKKKQKQKIKDAVKEALDILARKDTLASAEKQFKLILLDTLYTAHKQDFQPTQDTITARAQEIEISTYEANRIAAQEYYAQAAPVPSITAALTRASMKEDSFSFSSDTTSDCGTEATYAAGIYEDVHTRTEDEIFDMLEQQAAETFLEALEASRNEPAEIPWLLDMDEDTSAYSEHTNHDFDTPPASPRLNQTIADVQPDTNPDVQPDINDSFTDENLQDITPHSTPRNTAPAGSGDEFLLGENATGDITE